jgi:hypothetical protein
MTAPPRRRAPGAGRKCQVCIHRERPNIERAIATGVSRRSIGERYEVPPDAVYRHGRNHLSPEMRAAIATKLVDREDSLRTAILEEGDGIIGALKAIRSPLFSAFMTAIDCGNGRVAAALSGRLHENLQIAAKLTGELAPHAGVSITNVLLSPDFMRLRQQLLDALKRHPAAARDVAEIFRAASLRATVEMGAPQLIDATGSYS